MRIVVNDTVDLHYELDGAGETVVFVHGGFTDKDAAVRRPRALAGDFRVLTYDRRGHSRSGPGPAPATRRDEEGDLIGLILALDVAPVHLVGSSYGSSIVLGVTARRPELVRTVVAHEPALLDVVVDPGMQEIKAVDARHRRPARGRRPRRRDEPLRR